MNKALNHKIDDDKCNIIKENDCKKEVSPGINEKDKRIQPNDDLMEILKQCRNIKLISNKLLSKREFNEAMSGYVKIMQLIPTDDEIDYEKRYEHNKNICHINI